MATRIINHQSIELNWLNPIQIEEPKTLVLGSFNPYDPCNNEDWVDYYYGRRANFFWPSIAYNINPVHPRDYFYLNLGLKQSIMDNHFCCLDVINSIEINCQDKTALDQFIDNNIYSGFSDRILFRTNTEYNNHRIKVIRHYNQSIIDFLQNTTTITKVIHTMGNNRIPNRNGINPGENQFGVDGFNGFMNTIIDICGERNFLFESYSPSAYAVHSGRTNEVTLRNWLRVNLFL